MIYFISTSSHAYTHQVVEDTVPGFRRVGYLRLLSARRLPRGTYIFSDFDRLSTWQRELAARVYRVLEAGGCKVLNDPARWLSRVALLKVLKRAGINDFSVWEGWEADQVDRFPVFVRTAAAHRGVLTGLLPDRAALQAALAELVGRGYPVSDLMVVEYCAEPVRPGLFRKHSFYRMGDRYVGSTSVHDPDWVAKQGQMGVADQALYDEEYRDVVETPYVAALAPAFELAQVDYGRIDFGFVGGRPQVYEINTNPSMIPTSTDHPFPIRVKAAEHVERQRREAYLALDTVAAGPPVDVPAPPELATRKRRYRLAPGHQWMP